MPTLATCLETDSLKQIINDTFDKKNNPGLPHNIVLDAINTVITQLNQGTLRAASYDQNQWQVNDWVKKAILLYFKHTENTLIESQPTQYFDKVPLKFQDYTQQQFKQEKVRIVPPAHVRTGAYIGPNTVIMPSYINIGAYIDSNTMIDTWATVGSCAQIGKNVHISGGAGIGGVLEPIQATPTIIEDNCFIGARSEIVEGVIVEQGSVISMGVFIGQSTKIYDRQSDTILYGRVPAGSVVVPGTLPCKHSKCNIACAVIVKQVTAETRKKVSINQILRDM